MNRPYSSSTIPRIKVFDKQNLTSAGDIKYRIDCAYGYRNIYNMRDDSWGCGTEYGCFGKIENSDTVFVLVSDNLCWNNYEMNWGYAGLRYNHKTGFSAGFSDGHGMFIRTTAHWDMETYWLNTSPPYEPSWGQMEVGGYFSIYIDGKY